MIWFFDRGDEHLRYEVRRHTAEEGYELLVTYPDGRTSVEEFASPTELLERCAKLAESLRVDGWQPK